MSDPVQVYRGQSIVVRFEGSKCIHSRHCVLDQPEVFRANTSGGWIFPDSGQADGIVRVAHDCPSGAITYERLDGGAPESAPPVNVVRLRENGPLAFHAALSVDGRPAFRATLCRCGAPANKPFCDGSHSRAGFVATGEPATQASEPLPKRGGPLAIAASKDGPLEVAGNLELCSGTGRSLNRTQKTYLCRCGSSSNKPYCDGTHRKIGFSA